MIKYFCDKCGKECKDYEVFTIKVIPPEIRTWMDDAETGTYILCFDCTKKLNKWVNEDDFVKHAPQPDLETLDIPDVCKSCRNHPSNGGSGICNCTLGTPQVKC